MTEEEERARIESIADATATSIRLNETGCRQLAGWVARERADAFEAGRKVSANEASDFLSGHVVSLQAQLVASKQELRELRQTLSDRRDELTVGRNSAIVDRMHQVLAAEVTALRVESDELRDVITALREEIARKDHHYHLLSEECFALSHKPRYSTEAVDALLKEILWGTRGQGRADGLRHLAEAVRASREPKL